MTKEIDPNKYSKHVSDEVKNTRDYRTWIFDGVYRNFAWRMEGRNQESRSGPGSELLYTENLREKLPLMFSQFGINSILDAPCGDMNWMVKVLEECPIEYTGGDIVSEMIQDNKDKYPEYNFLELDVVEDDLPHADLFFCRDLFFHLHNDICLKIIENYLRSEIPYICLTTNKNILHKSASNMYVNCGEFRLIDIFEEPFNFPREVLYTIDDTPVGSRYPAKDMILLRREQLL